MSNCSRSITDGFITQWGESYSTSYARNMYGTITLPVVHLSAYSINITPQETKAESDASEVELNAIGISETSLSKFIWRCYGHASGDTNNGIKYQTIGY